MHEVATSLNNRLIIITISRDALDSITKLNNIQVIHLRISIIYNIITRSSSVWSATIRLGDAQVIVACLDDDHVGFVVYMAIVGFDEVLKIVTQKYQFHIYVYAFFLLKPQYSWYKYILMSLKFFVGKYWKILLYFFKWITICIEGPLTHEMK